MRVVVVGGGIAGLSAAIGLRRAGHEVVVLERAARIDPVGAGITLFANAMTALDRLGVGDAVAARGAAATRSAILTRKGELLAQVSTALLEGTIAVHRADLHAELAAAAGDVRLGVKVTAVHQSDDTVAAVSADGSEEPGDMLVGADGLRSVVRRAIAEASIRYAGYTAWRGVSSVPVEPGRLTESWGVGERFGLVDIGRGQTYCSRPRTRRKASPTSPEGGRPRFCAASPAGTSRSPQSSTRPTRRFSGTTFTTSRPLPRWSEGRIVLVGDAAHAATPGVGHGAAQAMEDAVVLADRLVGGGDLISALVEYEGIRRPRAEAVLRMSRRADKAAQLENALGWRLRNAVVRRLPERAQRRQLEPIVRYQL